MLATAPPLCHLSHGSRKVGVVEEAMRKIDSIDDQIHGYVTYEVGDGRRFRFDERTVKRYGAAVLLREMGLGDLLPTDRVKVMQHGHMIGTMSPSFDPSDVRSKSPMYDPRPGDFRRDGNTWIANKSLGFGDLMAIDGFAPA
jgi:hypothetical protein